MENYSQLQELNVNAVPFAENSVHPVLLRDNTGQRGILVTGDTAVRLYQSVRSNSGSGAVNNIESFHSTNENGQTCRICRFVTSAQELIPCPCNCSGSVGFVHMKCLQRWIRFRRDTRCEICKEPYDIPIEKRNYSALLSSLFKPKYIGSVVKNILNLAAVTPLVYFTMNQLVFAMDSINENPTTFKLIIVGPSMLLGTSIYFFLYFDWALSCLFRIRNILLHWWNFGDQDDDDYDVNFDLDTLAEFFEID